MFCLFVTKKKGKFKILSKSAHSLEAQSVGRRQGRGWQAISLSWSLALRLSWNSCPEHLCWMGIHGSLATFPVPICSAWLAAHPQVWTPALVCQCQKSNNFLQQPGQSWRGVLGPAVQTHTHWIWALGAVIAAQFSPYALDRENRESSSGGWREDGRSLDGSRMISFGQLWRKALSGTLTARSFPPSQMTEPGRLQLPPLNDPKSQRDESFFFPGKIFGVRTERATGGQIQSIVYSRQVNYVHVARAPKSDTSSSLRKTGFLGFRETTSDLRVTE